MLCLQKKIIFDITWGATLIKMYIYVIKMI